MTNFRDRGVFKPAAGAGGSGTSVPVAVPTDPSALPGYPAESDSLQEPGQGARDVIEGEVRQQRHPRALLEPFHRLADDSAFWIHQRDGLAVLATSSLFRVYRLQRPRS